MINFILLVNKLGQTRIAQYYTELPPLEKRTLESELVRKCLSRDDSKCSIIMHRNFKVIYRRYVSLYFIVGVDIGDEVPSPERVHVLQLHPSPRRDAQQLL